MTPALAAAIALTAADVVGRRCALQGRRITVEVLAEYVVQERGFTDLDAAKAIILSACHELIRRQREAVGQRRHPRQPRRKKHRADTGCQLTFASLTEGAL